MQDTQTTFLTQPKTKKKESAEIFARHHPFGHNTASSCVPMKTEERAKERARRRVGVICNADGRRRTHALCVDTLKKKRDRLPPACALCPFRLFLNDPRSYIALSLTSKSSLSSSNHDRYFVCEIFVAGNAGGAMLLFGEQQGRSYGHLRSL